MNPIIFIKLIISNIIFELYHRAAYNKQVKGEKEVLKLFKDAYNFIYGD